MNTLIFFAVTLGAALALRSDTRDCNHHRGHQDIYEAPSAYNLVDYTPHTQYGPPAPPRRNNYQQDTSEGGENNPRPIYSQTPSYSELRPAPAYGPPPSRSRVAAAAGIYDDYEDILYAQPASPQPPPPTPNQQLVRRYNLNYAQREPYYPRYESYTVRRPEYRVPVYYSPLIPDAFIPIHSHSPTSSATTEKSKPTEPQPTSGHHQHLPSTSTSSAEQEGYDDGQNRRQQSTIVIAPTNSPLQNEFKRFLFRKPFSGLRKLFRGSILAKRNKIGLIPSFIQGSTSNF